MKEITGLTIDVEELTFKHDEMKRKKTCKSKSEFFVELYNAGLSISEVSKMTQSHYSFVHSVITKRCELRPPIKVESKADKIRKLYDEGMKVHEISKQLQTNYSYCHTIVRNHRATTTE